MSSWYSGQVVVVSGGSAGVGRATVRALAERGAKVAILARGDAGLDGARRDALRLGAPAALALPTDIADADAVEAAAAQAEEQLGPIGTWMNVAMTSVFAPVHDITPDEFRRVTEVNYLGFVYGTLAALRRMRARDTGTILHVGSALAYRGIPLQAAYCASKHAIQGFHDSLRTELLAEGSNVRVTLVHLPALNTPQFGWVRTALPQHPQPVPPIFQPEVAARGVLWAAEHAPRELNVGMSTVATRLGHALAPGLLDRYLARTGWEDQQTDITRDTERWRDNLYRPVDDREDHGAHGIFDEQAKTSSPQLWAATHKALLGAVAAGVTALGVVAGRTLGGAGR
jgi:NAD(P)-dependent dehydrogenase (short-subunit alcohol dehydrogenase family)